MTVGFACGLIEKTRKPRARENLSADAEELTRCHVRFTDDSARVGQKAGVRRVLEELEVFLTLAVDRVSRSEQLLVLKTARVSCFPRRFTRVSDRALLLGVHHLRHLGFA